MERLLSAQEAARVLGVSMGLIYKMTSCRTLPHFKIGGRVKFRESDLEAWLMKCAVSAEKESGNE